MKIFSKDIVAMWELDVDSLESNVLSIQSASIVTTKNIGIRLSVKDKYGCRSDSYPSVLAAKQSFGRYYQPRAKWIKVVFDEG